MKTVVLKFGGTSVGSIDRIKNVESCCTIHREKNLGLLWFLLQ